MTATRHALEAEYGRPLVAAAERLFADDLPPRPDSPEPGRRFVVRTAFTIDNHARYGEPLRFNLDRSDSLAAWVRQLRLLEVFAADAHYADRHPRVDRLWCVIAKNAYDGTNHYSEPFQSVTAADLEEALV